MKTLDSQGGMVVENGRYHPVAFMMSRIFDPAVTKILSGLAFLFLVKISPTWLAVLLMGNLFIPLAFFIYSLRQGSISDIDITKREERLPYYAMLAICWFVTLVVVWFMTDVPTEIMMMQAWFVVFGVLNVSITYFWKISGHMMAGTALVLWLTLLWSPFFIVLLFTFIPLLGWSRWQMKKHTVAQVLAGICLMMVVVPIIWSVLKV